MLDFIFSPIGRITLIGLIALSFVLVVYNEGKQSARDSVLWDTVKAHETRNKIDIEVKGMSDSELCLSLGGVQHDCDKLRGMEKTPTGK